MNTKTIVTDIAFALALAVVCSLTSGCGVMGVRNMDAWGFKMTFAEGVDLHVGANSIDRVDDRRGVSPAASYVSNVRGVASGAVGVPEKY